MTLACKMAMCIALLPPEFFDRAIEIIRGNFFCLLHLNFNKLKIFTAKVPNNPIFDVFCDYLVRVWSTQNISVHGQLVRTNNSVESFHNYFFGKIGYAHPNVWMFLSKLKQAEHTKAVQLIRVKNGIEILELRRRTYRLAEDQIRAAEAALSLDGDVERFLRKVSHQSGRLMRTLSTIPGNLFIPYAISWYQLVLLCHDLAAS